MGDVDDGGDDGDDGDDDGDDDNMNGDIFNTVSHGVQTYEV